MKKSVQYYINYTASHFDEYFIDIGIPEDYEKAQRELGIRN